MGSVTPESDFETAKAVIQAIQDILRWGERQGWEAVSYRAALEELIRRVRGEQERAHD